VFPLAVTVMLWGAGSVVVGAPDTGPPLTDRAATATMNAPSARAPSVRTDWDIGPPSSRCRPEVGRSCAGDDETAGSVPAGRAGQAGGQPRRLERAGTRCETG